MEKKTERVKQQKVVNGKATRKKQSFIKKEASSLGEYIYNDLLKPTFKSTLSAIVKNGIDIILYGEVDNTKKTTIAGSRVTYTQYDSISKNGRTRASSPYSRGYDFDEIVLDTRDDAEAVLMQMDELIDAYGVVTVADYYDLVGVTGNYTDNNYGWDNLSVAAPMRLRGGGYTIKLPKAKPIK